MTTISPASAVATLLALLTESDPATRKYESGDSYRWDCGCEWHYAVDTWRRHKCCGQKGHVEMRGWVA